MYYSFYKQSQRAGDRFFLKFDRMLELNLLSRKPSGVSVYYKIADPIMFKLWELACDRIGNITSIADRDETIQGFTYDKLNRRTIV